MKIFTFIFLTGFFIFTGWFLGVHSLQVLLRQHNAESFPHVEGTVLSSEVTTSRGSKGRVYYHPHIVYQYNVEGMAYTGARYRYDGHPSDWGSANSIVNAHPAGSTVDVSYNPQDPADTVLSTAVDSQDVTICFIMVPMSFLFLWVISKTGKDIDWPWSGSRETGGVKVITEMMTTRVRLPRYQPLSVALLVTAVLFLAAAAVVGFGFQSTPPWVRGEWCLTGVLLVGAAVYLWQFLDGQYGKQDLVIDEGMQTIQLPRTYGRREQIPMSFSQIRSVILNPVRHQTKGGVYYTYLVTLEMSDNSQQKLIDMNEKKANSLATWLRGKFGLPAVPVVQDV